MEVWKLRDKWGAFIDNNVSLAPTGSGRLNGLTFAAKDVIAVKNHSSGAGNPDWLRTHLPSAKTAPSIERLLAEGAELLGMTHTDELMYSLNGENYHYGTPINPKAPPCIPGGSSSGSAVAVAAKLVDFALGTDTGGSVRVPSSYCGIYGFRPTHGIISMEAVIPLAASFDTLGWMASDSDTLLKVGEVLIEQQSDQDLAYHAMYTSKESWSLVDGDCANVLTSHVNHIEQSLGPMTSTELAQEGLTAWMDTFRYLQGYEIWKAHGQWIEQYNPFFGPGISDRFKWASTIKESDCVAALQLREQLRERVINLLGNNGLLILPTTPGTPPLLHQSGSLLEQRRSFTLQLSSIAGLTGLPQVHIPYKAATSAPFGISIIAGHGQDLRLLRFVNQYAALLSGEEKSDEASHD